MFRLERFRPDHLSQIAAAEPVLCDLIDGGEVAPDVLAQAGPAYTGIVDGRVIGAAGLIMLHRRRAVAWAWIGDCKSGLFQRVHREARRVLDSQAIGRVEATVRWDYENGHRWARLLGFELEHPRLRAYLPDGSDAALYARVKA